MKLLEGLPPEVFHFSVIDQILYAGTNNIHNPIRHMTIPANKVCIIAIYYMYPF